MGVESTARFHLISQPSAPANVENAAVLAESAWEYHRGLASYRPSPLRRLDGLAARLGVGALLLKDESTRFGLNAFKGLGASFAVHRWLADHPAFGDVTLTTATDGNHGRAVAWTARQHGFRAVIYMPSHSAIARIEAIQREGAKVVLVEAGYQAAVEAAQSAARAHGWIVIQDTASAEYQEIPAWIAAGYWTTARELEPEPHAPAAPNVDLILIQGGVGTFAAALVEYYWNRYGNRRPRIAVVEPTEADCLLASVRAGKVERATGSLHTIMAGLNCEYPSTTALATLAGSVDAFFAIPDHWAESAMKQLAAPVGADPRVIAGETGAAGIAGLLALCADPILEPVRRHLQVDGSTRILVWSTEGATDPVGWERVVGEPLPS